MSNYDNLLQEIILMEEDKAKELLAQILYSYSSIGTVGHDKDRFIMDVKHIYLKLAVDRHKL